MKNLNKRKELASKVLGVGINKIKFDNENLPEIKEAITKNDILELYNSGIIMIRDKKGKKYKKKRTTKRRVGKRKLIVRTRKRDYVILVRKLRRMVNELRNNNKITKERYMDLRKKIKSRAFKNKAHLKEYIKGE